VVAQITESLPALLTNVRMMYAIARFYSTPEHMTRLFTKITNQLVRRCKEQIMENGKIWDQDKVPLISNMKVSVELANVYRQQYKLAKETLAAQPKSKQFDFDEQVWPGSSELSQRAVSKAKVEEGMACLAAVGSADETAWSPRADLCWLCFCLARRRSSTSSTCSRSGCTS
jgi:hypothetical protein